MTGRDAHGGSATQLRIYVFRIKELRGRRPQKNNFFISNTKSKYGWACWKMTKYEDDKRKNPKNVKERVAYIGTKDEERSKKRLRANKYSRIITSEIRKMKEGKSVTHLYIGIR